MRGLGVPYLLRSPTSESNPARGRANMPRRIRLLAPISTAIVVRARRSASSLVHLQRGLCVMGYSSFYETSNICPEIVGKGARKPQSGAALQGDLRDAPLPDTARQRPRQLAAQDSRESRVRLPDGSQRHPRLQREGLGCAHRWLLDSKARACRLRRELGRAAAGDAPPLAERVRV